MTAKQIIDIGIAYAGITKVELAQRLSWSPQLLQKSLSTGKLTVDEWKQIGDVLGHYPHRICFFRRIRDIVHTKMHTDL